MVFWLQEKKFEDTKNLPELEIIAAASDRSLNLSFRQLIHHVDDYVNPVGEVVDLLVQAEKLEG